jgi:ribonuclease R
LLVHRSLFQQPGEKLSTQSLKEVAAHISDTERNSADAERDSKDVKLFAFLTAQLESKQPQPYPALVTDVRNFGFFVDVPGLGMSGLVPLSTMTDEFFQFDSNRSQLVGRRTRRVIKLGDKLSVQIAKVDRFKKQVDFRLIEAARLPGQPPPTALRPPAPARQAPARLKSSHHRTSRFNRGRARDTKRR